MNNIIDNIENLQENCELVENDLKTLEKKYKKNDLVDMIEISYTLATKKEMNVFNKLLGVCCDGVNTYALLVKFCYDMYSNSTYSDLYIFLNYELENCINLFIQKYFVEVKENGK